METTTFDYAYYDNSSPVGPSYMDSENNLNFHLSIFFYFMFLFSLFVNGLVLVIIHRWAVSQKVYIWMKIVQYMQQHKRVFLSIMSGPQCDTDVIKYEK